MGFSRYRADICSTNTGVLRLAEFFKFQTLGPHVSDDAAMAYITVFRHDGNGEGAAELGSI
jgi:hypothetical protein